MCQKSHEMNESKVICGEMLKKKLKNVKMKLKNVSFIYTFNNYFS